ncbi:unnamed protein product [Parajaminaea phylloscopi]
MESSAAVAPGLANGHAPYRPSHAATTPAHAQQSVRPVPYAGPTSPQSSMIASGQNYVVFPHFTLESGITLTNVPVAYKTWGKLDPVTKDNVLVVAHALTGSADVEDWWGPLLGPGKLFDPTRFFIFCANVLGSPYGSSGPCTRKGGEEWDEASQTHKAQTGWSGDGWWGPEYPATTVRDDVRIQKAVLDFLGVEAIFACIGGSMGGMSVLEWPLCFPVRFPVGEPSQLDNGAAPAGKQRPYISCIVPIATAARHGAWCISWAEAQRQSIYSDPLYSHGYYSPDQTPRAGLAAARMAALLTYRSRDSFENRFGRRVGGKAGTTAGAVGSGGVAEQLARRSSVAEQAALAHNEGNQTPRPAASLASNTTAESPAQVKPSASAPLFSAQSYLRYQGDKFVKRFDANCYVHLTRKMDTHDLARGRAHWGLGLQDPQEAAQKAHEAEAAAKEQLVSETEVLKGEKRLPHAGEEDDDALARVLGLLARSTTETGEADTQVAQTRQGALAPVVHVVSISSDGLFQTPEQRLIHALIPGSTFQEVPSPEGHDGFLLEFEAIGEGCSNVLKAVGPHYYQGPGVGHEEWKDWGSAPPGAGIGVGGERSAQNVPVKESVFGEVEDLTRW